MKLAQYTLTVNGQPFQCECERNIFRNTGYRGYWQCAWCCRVWMPEPGEIVRMLPTPPDPRARNEPERKT